VEESDDIEVRDFEFDEVNLRHLAAHGLTASVVWDVWLDEPVVVPDRPRHSGTHLMIEMDSRGVLWTIAMVRIDDETGLLEADNGIPDRTGG
jgi:hypothetical protein